MIRKVLTYHREIFKINLPLSVIVTLLSCTVHPEIRMEKLIYVFSLSFLGGGFVLGLLYFEFFRYREYYFYYNLGFSKYRLILTSYLFHLAILIPVIILANYARSL